MALCFGSPEPAHTPQWPHLPERPFCLRVGSGSPLAGAPWRGSGWPRCPSIPTGFQKLGEETRAVARGVQLPRKRNSWRTASVQSGRFSPQSPPTSVFLADKLRLRTGHLPGHRETEPGQPQDPSGHSTWYPCALNSLGILPREADSAPTGPQGACPATKDPRGLPSSSWGPLSTVLQSPSALPGAKAVSAAAQKETSSLARAQRQAPCAP